MRIGYSSFKIKEDAWIFFSDAILYQLPELMHLYIFLQFTEWCILNKLGLHGDLCTTDTNLKRTFQISRHHQCTGDFSQLSLVESRLPLVIQCGVHELLEVLAGVCRDSLTIVRATLWDGEIICHVINLHIYKRQQECYRFFSLFIITTFFKKSVLRIFCTNI